MSSQKLIFGTIFLMLLAACGQLSPYIDRQRNAGAEDVSRLYSGPSTPKNPVICYNPLWTSDEELQNIADNECISKGTGNKAKFMRKTYMDGKLFLPNHAHFKCVNTRN